MFIDTTLFVDLLRGQKKAIELIAKFEQHTLFTSELNVYELVSGAYLSKKDVVAHLDKIFAVMSKITVLPFDRKAALAAGKISGALIKEGKPIGEIDCLIAGVAIANGIKEILTANKDHFAAVRELKVISY